tara:strand:+ start:2481 stop:3080 length:600 start_codon:yes stop_codon:yes gene_type:complete
MKRFIFIILLILFSIKNSASEVKIDSYSFFYEEDGDTALILYYEKDDIYGQIISYGGYKWFKATYTNSDKETSTFIQPSNLGKSMDQDSWMQPRYQIDQFVYEFEEMGDDQYLTFFSPEATQVILGYMTRNQSFSIATLSSVAWYAGTFIPIKNVRNLDDLLKLNTKTFCMLLNDETITDLNSKQFKKEDLTIYREPCI